MPVGRFFKGVTDPTEERLRQMMTDELKAQREIVGRHTAWNRKRGGAIVVERSGESLEFVRSAGRQAAIQLCLRNRMRRGRHRRASEQIDVSECSTDVSVGFQAKRVGFSVFGTRNGCAFVEPFAKVGSVVVTP